MNEEVKIEPDEEEQVEEVQLARAESLEEAKARIQEAKKKAIQGVIASKTVPVRQNSLLPPIQEQRNEETPN